MARDPDKSRSPIVLLEEARTICELPRYVMYRLLGVSRQTYTAWCRGSNIRNANIVQIKTVGRALLLAYQHEHLPYTEKYTPWEKVNKTMRLTNYYAQMLGD